MVCGVCERKLAKNAPSAPDPWKAGSNNNDETGKAAGGRKLNENKLLSKKTRYQPYAKAHKCSTCRTVLTKEGIFCHMCAYSSGVCEMCGVKVLENKEQYRHTAK